MTHPPILRNISERGARGNSTVLPPVAGERLLPRPLAGDGLEEWFLPPVAGDALWPRSDGYGHGRGESFLPPVAGDGLREPALGRSTTCPRRRAMTLRNGKLLADPCLLTLLRFSPPMAGFLCPPTDLLRGLADDMSCLRALLPDAGC